VPTGEVKETGNRNLEEILSAGVEHVELEHWGNGNATHGRLMSMPMPSFDILIFLSRLCGIVLTIIKHRVNFIIRIFFL
jgi:hypothetical protein